MKIIISLLLIVVLGCLFLFFPPDPTDPYYESDHISYWYYTDKDIKNSPRITQDYSFSYVPPDGGQRESSTITFKGISDTKDLQKYLEGLGYKRYRVTDNGRNESWFSEKGGVIFEIWHDRKLNMIILTKTTM